MKKIVMLLMMALPILGLAQEEEKESVFEIFDVAQKAEFRGGDEGLQRFIGENITYPAEAFENDHQGTVMLKFVINKKGNVVDAEILNEGVCHKSLEKEALKVIQSTSGMWKPTIQRDKEVNMRFRMPVEFQIFGPEPKTAPVIETKKKKSRLFRRN
jgi:protein TonB